MKQNDFLVQTHLDLLKSKFKSFSQNKESIPDRESLLLLVDNSLSFINSKDYINELHKLMMDSFHISVELHTIFEEKILELKGASILKTSFDNVKDSFNSKEEGFVKSIVELFDGIDNSSHIDETMINSFLKNSLPFFKSISDSNKLKKMERISKQYLSSEITTLIKNRIDELKIDCILKSHSDINREPALKILSMLEEIRSEKFYNNEINQKIYLSKSKEESNEYIISCINERDFLNTDNFLESIQSYKESIKDTKNEMIKNLSILKKQNKKKLLAEIKDIKKTIEDELKSTLDSLDEFNEYVSKDTLSLKEYFDEKIKTKPSNEKESFFKPIIDEVLQRESANIYSYFIINENRFERKEIDKLYRELSSIKGIVITRFNNNSFRKRNELKKIQESSIDSICIGTGTGVILMPKLIIKSKKDFINYVLSQKPNINRDVLNYISYYDKMPQHDELLDEVLFAFVKHQYRFVNNLIDDFIFNNDSQIKF